MSGAQRQRPELNLLLDHLRERDVLVVTRLDRLARSTQDLLEISELLIRAGVGLRSLAERTHAGRVSAKQKGGTVWPTA